jgi:hypothetical protein
MMPATSPNNSECAMGMCLSCLCIRFRNGA